MLVVLVSSGSTRRSSVNDIIEIALKGAAPGPNSSTLASGEKDRGRSEPAWRAVSGSAGVDPSGLCQTEFSALLTADEKATRVPSGVQIGPRLRPDSVVIRTSVFLDRSKIQMSFC